MSFYIRRLGLALPSDLILVSVLDQRMVWMCRARPHRQETTFGNACASNPLISSTHGMARYVVHKRFVISTSRYGTGQIAGSNRTPLGLHRIAAKIGGGWPVGVVLRHRVPAGFTWQGQPHAPIAHRILWLEGLEPGLNRDGNVDSFHRYIYIHGLGDEITLGRPASIGCIHLASSDLIQLHDRVPLGSLVWITDMPLAMLGSSCPSCLPSAVCYQPKAPIPAARSLCHLKKTIQITHE